MIMLKVITVSIMNDNVMTPHQIKAARALIDWSQSNLGEKTGLSQAAIANLETGKHRPNGATETVIRKAFEEAGIEFIDGGVRLRPDGMEIIEGADFAARMPDIYFETLLRHNAEEVLINGVDYQVIDADTRIAIEQNIKRLQASGKRQRLLVQEGTRAKDVIGPPEWHRALPKALFSGVAPLFIFHHSCAFMLFSKQQVIIIRNADLAAQQKRQFEVLWDMALSLT